MATYELYLTDDSGRRITLLKNIAFMSMSRTLLGFGTVHVGLPFRDFKVFPAFQVDRRVDVWRSPAHGATLRREGSFFLRKYNVYTRDEDGVQIIEFYGRSPLDILRRQAVTSTTAANYSKTDKIDDMMKEIVRENFISPVQTAPSGEFSCDGDEGLGPTVSHTFYAQNVLDVLKDLRDMSISLNKITDSSRRIYFDVVEGSPLSNGGFGYTFRTYADLRGTDRTDGVVFSLENGNMKSPSYFEDHLDSITVASILNLTTPALNGSATSPDAKLSRWNTIVAAQQSSEATVDLNNAKANALLREDEADFALNVTFVDSPGSDRQPRSLYGVDWDLGDLLPVRYAGKDFNAEVEIVYVSVNEKGDENIVGISSPRVITPEDVEPTVPCEDTFAPYTVSLLHFNDADASTTFTDESGKTWTANGNAQIDTAQSVFGGASGLFDGTGDFISSADSADWQLDGGSNANEWTIDGWVRFNGDPGTTQPGFVQQRVDNGNFWAIRLNVNNLTFNIFSATVQIVLINNAWNPATATWYHWAVVKQGTTGYKMFIDGVQIGSTQTDTDVIPNFAGGIQIGRYTNNAGTSSDLNGWLDEVRISKGVARWTADFTPPMLQYCDP